MTPPALMMTGLNGQPVEVEPAALERLAASQGAPLLRPEDDGFDEAVLIWNAMAARAPALVAQPTSADDVAAAVSFARERGLLLSVKGGGHNIAGTSLAEGGLTLDMSRMKQVSVDPGARLARVGAGCLLREVDEATQEHGLAAVLGFVSETGVAGLTLGGGFGYLTRRFGFTVDSLEEVEIVTADGQVRRASRNADEDLFWALRGGGGNLGVATEFTFRLQQVGPQVKAGMVVWSAEHAQDVLALYRQATTAAPRELTLALTMRLAPPAPFIPAEWHGRPVVGIVACHTGEPAQAEGDLAPLRVFGQPIVDLIADKPYTTQQSMLDATQPKGLHYYWKSEFFSRLPDDALAAFREQASGIESPLSQIILFHVDGALRERAGDDGAVGNRDAAFVWGAAGAWRPDDPRGDGHRGWVRTAWEAMRPYSTGGNYVNFQTLDEDQARTRDSYGANYERLAKVKAAYDPSNLFRRNRNVHPAA